MILEETGEEMCLLAHVHLAQDINSPFPKPLFPCHLCVFISHPTFSYIFSVQYFLLGFQVSVLKSFSWRSFPLLWEKIRFPCSTHPQHTAGLLHNLANPWLFKYLEKEFLCQWSSLEYELPWGEAASSVSWLPPVYLLLIHSWHSVTVALGQKASSVFWIPWASSYNFNTFRERRSK